MIPVMESIRKDQLCPIQRGKSSNMAAKGAASTVHLPRALLTHTVTCITAHEYGCRSVYTVRQCWDVTVQDRV